MTPSPVDRTRESRTRERPVTFLVTLGETTLGVEDVWPNGDAPENPTAADVVAVMEDCGGMCRVVRDWNLLIEMEVTDNSGRTEVVR